MELRFDNLAELAAFISVLDLTRLSTTTAVAVYPVERELTGAPLNIVNTALGNLDAFIEKGRAAAGYPVQNGVPFAHGEPVSSAPVEPPTGTPLAAPTSALDAAGVPHDTRIHSDPAKTNKDGTWRARRGVDEAYAAEVTAELLAAQAAGTPADAQEDAQTVGPEPVATETHALPTHTAGDLAAMSDKQLGSLVLPDLTALIEASKAEAGDASDSLQELFTVAKEFINTYGKSHLDALKAATVADDNGVGKTMQVLTPGERRLLRACMDNYPAYV